MPRRPRRHLKFYTYMRNGKPMKRGDAYDIHDAVHFAMHLKVRYRYSPLEIVYNREVIMKLQPDELNVDTERMEYMLSLCVRQADERGTV